MLSFEEIRKEFPKNLNSITSLRAMAKEYLQCKVLEIVYSSPFKDRLIFIGGTKLRLLNNFRRFSEDLDFDIKGAYEAADHLALCNYVIDQLENMNIVAELDEAKKIKDVDVQTRFINFPGFLDSIGLKDVPNRKFYLKIDAQKHSYGSYVYESELKILNRFDVFTPIVCAPDEMILATKLCSILERAKGRDFYDITELIKTTRADTAYINNRLTHGRINVPYENKDTYLNLLDPALEKVDWQDKTKEIEKFIFNPSEATKVKLFKLFATNKQVCTWLE